MFETQFCLGVGWAGGQAFQFPPSGVEVAEENFDHVANGGVVPVRFGGGGPFGMVF